MSGIQETKEAAIAAVKIVKLFVSLSKDGIDVKDATALAQAIFSDQGGLRTAIMEAVEGLAKIPEELKDLDITEGFDLGLAVYKEIVG